MSGEIRRLKRAGITLIELTVVIGVLAVLLAFALVAVQRARDAAAQTQSRNNVRAITLAVHHFADNTGRLPRIPLDQVRGGWSIQQPTPSIMLRIRPYLEQSTKRSSRGKLPVIPLYLSPADPTASRALADSASVSSYAANAVAFRQALPITTAFADGTSNTIAFAEHYAYRCARTSFYYNLNDMPGSLLRRATFADITDVEPVTQGSPPVTNSTAAAAGLTFQVAPTISKCNPRLAQTPHSNGMIVGLADGSVRTISQSVSPWTYWALVTPCAGDVPSGDW